MSYIKAVDILPGELLEQIQEYVDGGYIYIPRTLEHKAVWGTGTSIRREMEIRNREIYHDHVNGFHTTYLSEKYFLSVKSIQRIIRQQRAGDDE